jgi:uncharacterized membrane protein YhhN
LSFEYAHTILVKYDALEIVYPREGSFSMAATTIILALILMPALLYYESKEISKGILPVKAIISVLFVVAALVQPRPVPDYFSWLLPGLICCLGGDVFLALPQKRCSFPGSFPSW